MQRNIDRPTLDGSLSAGWLLLNAIRAVNLHTGDGEAAIAEIIARGATSVHFSDLDIGHLIRILPESRGHK